MSYDKPARKRFIGPAMQWAKPKINKDATGGQGDHAINIELTDVASNVGRTAHDPVEHDTLDEPGGAASPSSSSTLASHPSRNVAEPAKSRPTDSWWRRSTQRSDGEDSAWSEYADSLTRGVEQRFPGGERDLDSKFTTYSYGSDEPESSTAVGYQPESAQHNASSLHGGQPPSSHRDPSAWLEYLLPVAVVALIMFLALLTVIS